MTRLAKYLVAAATAGLFAVPAAAQYSPQPYQQPYAQPYRQPYAQPYSPNQYGYPNQGTNVIGQVIDQLLGNRYNVTDRQAIRQCASAAVAQASAQYGGNRGYNQGYNGQPYGNNQGYNGYGSARVTAITDVQRRSSGLRVTGMLDSRGGYGAYGNHGYANQGYGNPGYGNRNFAAGGGDLTFRCNVDYRGAVTNVRVRPNTNRY